MTVKDWVNRIGGDRVYEPFEGGVKSGNVGKGVSFPKGVEGRGVLVPKNSSVAVNTPGEMRLGYPLSVNVWVYVPSGRVLSQDILLWGETPGVRIRFEGDETATSPGSVLMQVRMSNGAYGGNFRRARLERNRWHLLTVVVTQRTIWGGVWTDFYVDGVFALRQTITGGLLNIINLDRPSQAVIGGGDVIVDELVLQKSALSAAQVQALFSSVDSLTGGARNGWGIVF